MKKLLITFGGMLLFGFIFPTTFLIGAKGVTHLIKITRQIIGV